MFECQLIHIFPPLRLLCFMRVTNFDNIKITCVSGVSDCSYLRKGSKEYTLLAVTKYFSSSKIYN